MELKRPALPPEGANGDWDCIPCFDGKVRVYSNGPPTILEFVDEGGNPIRRLALHSFTCGPDGAVSMWTGDEYGLNGFVSDPDAPGGIRIEPIMTQHLMKMPELEVIGFCPKASWREQQKDPSLSDHAHFLVWEKTGTLKYMSYGSCVEEKVGYDFGKIAPPARASLRVHGCKVVCIAVRPRQHGKGEKITLWEVDHKILREHSKAGASTAGLVSVTDFHYRSTGIVQMAVGCNYILALDPGRVTLYTLSKAKVFMAGSVEGCYALPLFQRPDAPVVCQSRNDIIRGHIMAGEKCIATMLSSIDTTITTFDVTSPAGETLVLTEHSKRKPNQKQCRIDEVKFIQAANGNDPVIADLFGGERSMAFHSSASPLLASILATLRAKAQINIIQVAYAEVEKRFKDAQEQLESCQSDVKQAREATVEAASLACVYKKENEGMARVLFELKKSNADRHAKELEQSEDRDKAAEKLKQRHAKELRSMQRKIEEVRSAKSVVGKEQAEMGLKVKEEEIDRLRVKLHEAETNVFSMGRSIERLDEDVRGKTSDIRRMETDSKALRGDIGRLQGDNKRLASEKKKRDAEVKRLSRELVEARKKEEVQAKVRSEELFRLQGMHQTQIVTLTSQIQELLAQKNALQITQSALVAQAQQYLASPQHPSHSKQPVSFKTLPQPECRDGMMVYCVPDDGVNGSP